VAAETTQEEALHQDKQQQTPQTLQEAAGTARRAA